MAASTNQFTFLNIVVSEKGLSEFSEGKRIIFIPKDRVRHIEIKFGSQAGRPLPQVILGLILIGFGLAGSYLVAFGGVRGLYWGLGLIAFGGIGVFCLYEAIKEGHYLQVTGPQGTRKLKMVGEFNKIELPKFIQDASGLGYEVRDCLKEGAST